MSNLLLLWVRGYSSQLIDQGFAIEFIADASTSSCTVVDIESKLHGGRICFWLPDTFEFQFHSKSTGKIVLLNTVQLPDVDKVIKYMNSDFLDSLSMPRSKIE
jgi:hypothetical protein